MIRLARCTQASKAGHYFRLHLQTGDSENGPVKPGVSLRPRWFGEGCKDVGLNETTPPAAEHLTRLGRGNHPLRTRNARLAPNVNRKRAYYDLTIAAPKTISIAALLRPDHPTSRAVLHAHVAAVEKVAEELGPCIVPRSGQAPTRWIGVSFHHTHTRESDPHLHTHLVVPNIARNTAGDWRAIQVKIGGFVKQRLELRYGHELARQLRLFGLGSQIVMRSNGLPELRGLLPFRRVFSKARLAVLAASEAAGAQIPPTGNAPAAGLLSRTGRSGLPIHPQRTELRARDRLADSLRKPKAKASDDPALLRDEALRWSAQLRPPGMRSLLSFLEDSDPAVQRRRFSESRGAAPLVVGGKLPALRALIFHARRKHLDDHGRNTPPVVFKAVMREAAGNYQWQEIRAAMRQHLKERKVRLARIREMIEADSERLEADRIRRANLAAQGIVIVPLQVTPDQLELMRLSRAGASNRPLRASPGDGATPTPLPSSQAPTSAPENPAELLGRTKNQSPVGTVPAEPPITDAAPTLRAHSLR